MHSPCINHWVIKQHKWVGSFLPFSHTICFQYTEMGMTDSFWVEKVWLVYSYWIGFHSSQEENYFFFLLVLYLWLEILWWRWVGLRLVDFYPFVVYDSESGIGDKRSRSFLFPIPSNWRFFLGTGLCLALGKPGFNPWHPIWPPEFHQE